MFTKEYIMMIHDVYIYIHIYTYTYTFIYIYIYLFINDQGDGLSNDSG